MSSYITWLPTLFICIIAGLLLGIFKIYLFTLNYECLLLKKTFKISIENIENHLGEKIKS